jgi:uncharacterized protein YndB with AHSA1/START domain
MSQGQRGPQPTLKLTRIIAASREVLFDAWTNVESVKQWMCPEGSSVSLAQLDVRVGGTFRVEMRIGEEDVVHTGVYREIVFPEKLVFTWVSKHTHYRESLVTLEFLARGEATELVLLQTQLPDEEALERHITGWTNLMKHLVSFLQMEASGHQSE